MWVRGSPSLTAGSRPRATQTLVRVRVRVRARARIRARARARVRARVRVRVKVRVERGRVRVRVRRLCRQTLRIAATAGERCSCSSPDQPRACSASQRASIVPACAMLGLGLGLELGL